MTEQATASRMLRDLFLGFVKVHLLHHASKGPLYGVAFQAELERHGYHLSPGTLYPLLHGLEAAGYLDREDRVEGGKVRKYYRITPLGAGALGEAKARMHELVRVLVEDEDDLQVGADPAWKVAAGR